MSFQDLEKALKLIEDNGGDFAGKKSDDLIAKAEQALVLKFPPSYKQFLNKLGCGGIEGSEIFGVIDENFEKAGIPDGIWLTLDERKSGLPEYFVVVSEVGDGAYYVLDTSQVDVDGECPVVTYEINGSSEKVADDFGSFLLSELQEVLSSEE